MNAPLLRAVRERDLQAQIVEAAELCGWRVVHVDAPAPSCPVCGTYVPPLRVAGHPDLELVRGPQLIYLECKTERGRVSLEQEETLARLAQVRFVNTAMVRPRHLDEVLDTLRSAAR